MEWRAILGGKLCMTTKSSGCAKASMAFTACPVVCVCCSFSPVVTINQLDTSGDCLQTSRSLHEATGGHQQAPEMDNRRRRRAWARPPTPLFQYIPWSVHGICQRMVMLVLFVCSGGACACTASIQGSSGMNSIHPDGNHTPRESSVGRFRAFQLSVGKEGGPIPPPPTPTPRPKPPSAHSSASQIALTYGRRYRAMGSGTPTSVHPLSTAPSRTAPDTLPPETAALRMQTWPLPAPDASSSGDLICVSRCADGRGFAEMGG